MNPHVLYRPTQFAFLTLLISDKVNLQVIMSKCESARRVRISREHGLTLEANLGSMPFLCRANLYLPGNETRRAGKAVPAAAAFARNA